MATSPSDPLSPSPSPAALAAPAVTSPADYGYVEVEGPPTDIESSQSGSSSSGSGSGPPCRFCRSCLVVPVVLAFVAAGITLIFYAACKKNKKPVPQSPPAPTSNLSDEEDLNVVPKPKSLGTNGAGSGSESGLTNLVRDSAGITTGVGGSNGVTLPGSTVGVGVDDCNTERGSETSESSVSQDQDGGKAIIADSNLEGTNKTWTGFGSVSGMAQSVPGEGESDQSGNSLEIQKSVTSSDESGLVDEDKGMKQSQQDLESDNGYPGAPNTAPISPEAAKVEEQELVGRAGSGDAAPGAGPDDAQDDANVGLLETEPVGPTLIAALGAMPEGMKQSQQDLEPDSGNPGAPNAVPISPEAAGVEEQGMKQSQQDLESDSCSPGAPNTVPISQEAAKVEEQEPEPVPTPIAAPGAMPEADHAEGI